MNSKMIEKVAALIREHHRTHVRYPSPGRTNEPRRTFHQGDREAAEAILTAYDPDKRLREALVEAYRRDPVRVAKICDEELDRSGALLGYVRDAALSHNGG